MGEIIVGRAHEEQKNIKQNVMQELKNQYYIMRHGRAISNVKEIMSSWPETFDNSLTEHGVITVQDAAGHLKEKHIEMIFASDLKRTAQTAAIMSEALGLPPQFDARLREMDFGSMNGKPVNEIRSIMGRYQGPGYAQFGGEDYKDTSRRVSEFLKDVEGKYQGKTILIVSHQAPLTLLEEKVCDIPLLEITKIPDYIQIQNAEIRDLNKIVAKVKLSPV